VNRHLPRTDRGRSNSDYGGFAHTGLTNQHRIVLLRRESTWKSGGGFGWLSRPITGSSKPGPGGRRLDHGRTAPKAAGSASGSGHCHRH